MLWVQLPVLSEEGSVCRWMLIAEVNDWHRIELARTASRIDASAALA